MRAVGEGEIAQGEGVAAVGQGSLNSKGDIRDVADKTIMEVQGGQAPSKEIPEEGDRLDVSSGRYCGRVQKQRNKIMREL